jgi:hypothetical protein
MEQDDVVMKVIGKALGTKIKYIEAMTIVSKTDDGCQEEKVYNILLGIDGVYITKDDYNEIKFTFEYSAVNSISLDDGNLNGIIFHLDLIERKGYPPATLSLNVRNRDRFVKSLMCYYSIHFMYKFGKMGELVITKCNQNMGIGKTKILNSGIEVKPDIPKGYIKKAVNGFE